MFELQRPWWHKHCRRGDSVSIYTLPRTVDVHRLRIACQVLLDELLGPQDTSAHEANVQVNSRWSPGKGSSYQLLQPSTGYVPAWFGLMKPCSSRLRGSFVVASSCVSLSPQLLEKSIFGRFNSRDLSNTSDRLPPCPKAPISSNTESGSPTTSTLAILTVGLASSMPTAERRTFVAAAWSLVLSKLYGRPSVSIEYLKADGGSHHALENVSSSSIITSATGEPSDQGPSTRHTTIISEFGKDELIPSGGFELLQRRTYYPYETALEWQADEREFRFQCHWDSSVFSEVTIRTLINSFRQKLEDMHKPHQSSPPNLPQYDGKQSCSPLDSLSGSALSTPCTESTDVADNLDQISDYDRKVMLTLNSREIPAATRTVSQLVSDNSVRQPEAIAVTSWDRNLAYKALENSSRVLAAHLRQNIGAQPTPILTVFGKSALAVVVLLAIIRSGHYYVPVDPSHPLARKKTVFEQAGCRTVLTSTEAEQTCSGLESPSTQVVTWEFLETLTCPNDDDDVDASSVDGIGVVLFTSGSTGKPKGAVLSHRALSTSLLDHGAYLGVDSSSQMLSFASYAFDAHLWDTWTCLMYGGTVCIPNDSERTNDLQGYINRAQISIGMLMSAALQYLEPDAMPSLKALGVGGDAVTKSHLLPWKNSQTQVFEVYGPTERTVFSSLNTRLSAEDPSDIGKPVGGGIWITDPANVNQLLPCGAEGELVITGHHIADGYLNDAAKTEAAFVTPTWPDWVPGPRRAYRTGDLAVLDSSGTIRIRGRMDRQIKLNGLRIEGGELEHHIASCELHASLPIVEKVETAPGKHQLACFFVPRGTSAPSCAILPPNEALAKIEDTIREKLAREVPAGWMPNTFVFQTQMPLNTSDKIDRQHLLRLFKESASPPSPPQPSTSLQAKTPNQRMHLSMSDATGETIDVLRGAWSQVLRIDHTRISDNAHFLRLGGSSMDAIRLVANLRKQSVDINTTQVLTHPILSEQASLLNQKEISSIKHEQARARTPEPFELLL